MEYLQRLQCLTRAPKKTVNLLPRIHKLGIIASRGIISLIAALSPVSLAATEANVVTRQYIARASQGKVSEAGLLFDKLAAENSSALDRELAEQYRHRFVLRDEEQHTSSGNIFVDQLLTTYRQYWIQTMMGELSPQEGADWLRNSLDGLLAKQNQTVLSDKLSDVFTRLGPVVEQQGFYSDYSFSSPWHDLMLWKTQESKPYVIELTDQSQAVAVVFMDDFFSIGWSDFATLGMSSTGGWAGKDALYCVSWAWNRSSENFHVSFLKHEGRHFADFSRFPRLHVIDLEYRAKLTELAFASSSLPRILKKFTDNGAPNTDSPHAFANYRVVRDLYRALFNSAMPESGNPWRQVGASLVNPAARALLDEHTQILEKGDALLATGVVYKQAPEAIGGL